MKNRILVYDDHCPLCTWYSGAFVKYGFLQPEERKAFSSLDVGTLNTINFERARNEIPLLDKASGEVLYGIDALLEILGRKLPWIKRTGNIKPVKWFLKKLYKLVSANRKVIVAKKCGPGAIDCSPDMNYRYRFIFLFISLLFNTLMLFPLYDAVFSRLSYFNLSSSGLQMAHFGLVFINCLLTLFLKKEKAIEYIGQINMLAIFAILFVSPLILIRHGVLPELATTVYLISVTIFIFKEYLRRMEYAGILFRHKWIASINIAGICGFILVLFG